MGNGIDYFIIMIKSNDSSKYIIINSNGNIDYPQKQQLEQIKSSKKAYESRVAKVAAEKAKAADREAARKKAEAAKKIAIAKAAKEAAIKAAAEKAEAADREA